MAILSHYEINNTKTEGIEALEKLHKNSTDNTVRKRSQCLFLSHQKRTITDLSSIFDVNRRTVERWLDSWSKIGKKTMYLMHCFFAAAIIPKAISHFSRKLGLSQFSAEMLIIKRSFDY